MAKEVLPDERLLEVGRLFARLRENLDFLQGEGHRLMEVEALDNEIAQLEGMARELLVGAEMTSELDLLDEARRESRRLRQILTGEVDRLFAELRQMMEAAVALSDEALKRFDTSISDALVALYERRAVVEQMVERGNSQVRERESGQPEPVAERTVDFTLAGGFAAPSDGVERRRHRRDEVAVEVKLAGPNRLLSGNAENVGVGGLFIAGPEEFELGTLIHISCELPDGRVVRADGVVSWTRSAAGGVVPGIGVEFVALSDEDREELEALRSRQSV